MKTFFILCSFLLSNMTSAASFSARQVGDEQIVVQAPKGHKTHRMDVPDGMKVEAPIQSYSSSDLLVVVVPIADHVVATSFVYGFDITGNKLWEIDLAAFNPSQPLIEKDHVYLAAIGKIMKVNKKTGQQVWAHEGLYEKKHLQFDGATQIKREGSKIVFASNLSVDDNSGRILGGKQ